MGSSLKPFVPNIITYIHASSCQMSSPTPRPWLSLPIEPCDIYIQLSESLRYRVQITEECRERRPRPGPEGPQPGPALPALHGGANPVAEGLRQLDVAGMGDMHGMGDMGMGMNGINLNRMNGMGDMGMVNMGMADMGMGNMGMADMGMGDMGDGKGKGKGKGPYNN